VRPSYQGQVQVSYNQAGLICDFIAGKWGHEALVTMLKAFADGDKTEAALEKGIDMTASKFDELFGLYILAKFGDVADGLEAYQLTESQMQRSAVAEDWVGVETMARDLIRQYPQRVGSGNPYEFLAGAREKLLEPELANQVLLEWYESGGHSPDNLLKLSSSLRDNNQDTKASEMVG